MDIPAERRTDVESLASARYAGDVELLDGIRKDAALVEEQKRLAILRTQGRTRMRLLANAVRVAPGLLPQVAGALARVQARVDVGKPLEAFVFADADVNAFVAEVRSRFLVGLSSRAVEVLSEEELEFVIGHELGHAFYAHTEVGAASLAEQAGLGEERTRLVRAWQRAAEISADRVGLLGCQDMEVATTALVKTLAGLPLEGVRFRPEDITGQWESLLDELMDEGAGDLWEHSHPFLPLRIKALEAFWNDSEHHGDTETRQLLSVIDGPGRAACGGGEGVLARFLLWGGLYVGLADGPLAPDIRARLEALTVPGVDLDAELGDGEAASARALEQFRAAKAARRSKLRADELSSILRQLVGLAAREHQCTDPARARLVDLARELGIAERAVILLMEQHQEGAHA